MRHVNAVVRLLLRARLLRRLVDGAVCELAFTGRRTGRKISLPVMYAQRGDRVVVLVGDPAAKRWWRNFSQPHPVRVLLRGAPRTGVGVVVAAGNPAWNEANGIYTARFPDLPAGDDPFVVITLSA